MCGVMKSFWSAIIFEQQRFGHHRQKEKRHQTHQSRLHREVYYPREWRVQHQHKQTEHCTDSPTQQQLTGSAVSWPGRSQQRIGAELYCESQSSRNQHCIVLIDRSVVRPQNDRRDDYENGGNPSEEAECAFLLHGFPLIPSPFPLPSSLFPSSAIPLLVVAFLRRADLAVHVVEGGGGADEHTGNGEQPVEAEFVIEPLASEEEDEDGERELQSQPGEIGAGETLVGTRLRPLSVIHSALKLTACEDFHTQRGGRLPKRRRKFQPHASRRSTRSQLVTSL